jgi:hypothetical protein
MLELAALARWDKEAVLGSSPRMDRQRDRDLEYHSRKAASEHTQIKLLKICREIDAALRRPVAEILLHTSEKLDMTDDFRSRSSETERLSIEGPQSDHSMIVSADSSTAISLAFGLIANLNGTTASCGDVVPTSRLARLPNLCVRIGKIANRYVKSCANFSAQVSAVVKYLRGVIRSRVKILRRPSSPGFPCFHERCQSPWIEGCANFSFRRSMGFMGSVNFVIHAFPFLLISP